MAHQEQRDVQAWRPHPRVDAPMAEPPQPAARATTFSPRVLFAWKRLPLTVVVVLLALLCVRLGIWQLDRRAQRLAYNAMVQQRLDAPPVQIAGPPAHPENLAFHYAAAAGSFDYDNEVVLLDGGRADEPGVRVLTPLRITGSDVAVLVDRGWLPAAASSPAARKAYRGPSAAQVRGLVQLLQQRASGPAPAKQSGTRQDAWFEVDIPRMQRQLPYRLLPFYLEQSPEPGAPDLPSRTETIMLDEGPHLGYAAQWFTFAVALAVGYVAVGGRRPLVPNNAPGQT